MEKKYKKGQILTVIYEERSGRRTLKSTGIVIGQTDSKLILGHNFSVISKRPIDITKIPLKNIIKSEGVVPKEINSLHDLQDNT